MFLHVFPDFEVPQPDSPTGEGGEVWSGESDMHKPEQLCIACSIGTFQEALEQKVGWYINYCFLYLCIVIIWHAFLFAATILEPKESPSNNS